MDRVEQDQRRWSRISFKADAIATTHGRDQLKCTITDINAYGARVHFDEAMPPEAFFLIDVLVNVAHRARVVWREAPLVGTRFTESWSLASDTAPEWLRDVRSDALRSQARQKGIRLAWSAPSDPEDKLPGAAPAA